MRWTPGGVSGDIEDRRDQGGGGGGGGFGGMRLGLGGLLILFVLSLVFKQNFFALLGGGSAGSSGSAAVSTPDPARDEAEKPLVQFVSFVLDDTQKTWEQLLPQQAGTPYRHAKLVLFRDSTNSACGGAESATGPFYCPGDEKVYIDLSFYDELKRRFGAPGRICASLRPRSRSGSPRPETHRHREQGTPVPAAESRLRERCFRTNGIASGLSGGSMGAFHAAAGLTGTGRRAIRVGRRGSSWR